ncbi:hypothetical protein ACFVHS_38580, partial [Streptomyces sp. NPDC057746]
SAEYTFITMRDISSSGPQGPVSKVTTLRGKDPETLEHVAAGRGISFLARSASVFYSHPDVVYVPIPELAPERVCLAVAASQTSPVVLDFVTAAQSTAEITAECGNYEMWQLGGDVVSRHA